MKNINLFKYKETNKFGIFLVKFGYNLADVVGFELVERKQHKGNVGKEYCIYFKDNERANFKVVIFKNHYEYHQAYLGFKGNKLFDGIEDADVRLCK